jgi:hypothetical protein
MKTILIHALLVVSAAFAPGMRDAIEFPERACEVAQTGAAPLFWHLWDKLLTRELARGIRPAPSASAEMEWQGALSNDTVVCIFFHVFLKHAFDGGVSATQKNNTFLVSIPELPIRRTIGRSCSSCLASRLLAAGSEL